MGFFKKLKEKKDKIFKLSRETAEEQLGAFLEFYMLSPESFQGRLFERMDQVCERIILTIRKGKLTLKEDGTASHKLEKNSEGKEQTVAYAVLKGKHKIQGAAASDDDSDEAIATRRMYAIMASLGNLSENDIIEFHPVDMSIVESLSFLYVNV